MTVIKHFVDGKIFEGSSKRTGKVYNPATGEETSKVNLASKADINLAVEKAKKSFKLRVTGQSYVMNALFVTSKIKFSNPPILEFKVLQNAFEIKKTRLQVASRQQSVLTF